MQFTTLFLSLLVGSVAAQSVCYDNFDCILSGGGTCVKPAGKILGYVLFSRAAVVSRNPPLTCSAAPAVPK
jgi:hypothetical protein